MKKIPIFIVLVGFVAGILINEQFPCLQAHQVISSGLILLLTTFALFKSKNYFKLKYPWLAGWITFSNAALFALSLCLLYQTEQHAAIKKNQGDKSYFKAYILDAPQKKERSYKVSVRIYAALNDKQLVPTDEKALLYLTQLDSKPRLVPGQSILFKNSLIEIQAPANPTTFNYKKYCNRHGIYRQAFLKPETYRLLSDQKQNLELFFIRQRFAILSIIDKYIQDNKSNGFAKALLLGYKNDIDNETWNDYSRTGIVHIIAISGMHIGIVYSTVLTMLLLLPFFKARKNWALLLALMCIWLFSGISGFSPSVVRAATMFTAVGVGKLLKRQEARYNLLLVTALAMLILDPQLLFDIGFQLSFCAVLGLMLLSKPLYNVLYLKNYALQKTWQLSSSTLAAQVFTLPLCIYYFKQFPLLFLLANIVAIPLTFIVLWLEILLILVAPWGVIAKQVAALCSSAITFCNTIIHHFAQNKWTLITGLHIDLFQFIMLTLLTIAITVFLTTKTRQHLIYTGIGLFLFSAYSAYASHSITKKRQLIVYHLNNESAVEYYHHGQYILLDANKRNEKALHYNIHPVRDMMKAYKRSNIESENGGSFRCFSMGGKNIVYTQAPLSIQQKCHIHYLIIANNAWPDLNQVLKFARIDHIIVDGSNKVWKISGWEKECAELNLPFFSTHKQGAFVVNL